MFFSIAPQTVVIPGGPTLCFQVNPADSALVEIAMTGEDARGTLGTHILTFNRNGGPSGQQFVPTPGSKPLAGFASVNNDTVRAAPAETEAEKRERLSQFLSQDEVNAEIAKDKAASTPAPETEPVPSKETTELPPKTVTSTSLNPVPG